MTSLTFAWLCCAICVALSATCAIRFCKARPRLFTIHALFALVWALLLPYYDKSTSPSELFAAYSGFLLVYIGGLLALEAVKDRAAESETVDFIQKLGLWIFLILASPSVLRFESPHWNFSISRAQHELLIAAALTMAGYVSICYGFCSLCGKGLGTALAILLALYSGAEIKFIVDAWSGDGSMSDSLRITFGIAKLAFTGLFCWGVTRLALTDDERKKGFLFWLLKLIGFK